MTQPPRRPRPLRAWLRELPRRPEGLPGGLRTLLDRAQALEGLTRALRAELGEPLGTRCRALALEGGTLVVGVEGPAWATRLRYLLPRLPERLARRGLPVKAARLRLLPGPIPMQAADLGRGQRAARGPGPRAPSPQARQALEAAAAACHHPALQAALSRLAARGRDGPGKA